jgi:hypothetical protein
MVLLMPEQTGPSESERRDPHGMTRCEKYALIILEEGRGDGVLTTGRTSLIDGQPWINWRTARSLERRKFVRIDYHGSPAEGGDVVMT